MSAPLSPQRYSPWLEPLHQKLVSIFKRLPSWVAEFLAFGIKQGWACLFGGIMLTLIIATKFFWHPEWPLARYDFLFIAALATQVIFLVSKLESLEEAKVILVFHIVGTAMEIFKTHVGSWIYPEHNLLRLGGVPLFSGFMYSCVGSYIARVWRIFNFRFTHFPPIWASLLLCLAIYVNFFSHHYFLDLRYALFAFAALLYGRTWVYYTPFRQEQRMPLIVGFFLVALFIWLAENIGTFSGTWRYPHQAAWQLVPLQKLSAWFLLMIISFVLVTLVHARKAK